MLPFITLEVCSVYQLKTLKTIKLTTDQKLKVVLPSIIQNLYWKHLLIPQKWPAITDHMSFFSAD